MLAFAIVLTIGMSLMLLFINSNLQKRLDKIVHNQQAYKSLQQELNQFIGFANPRAYQLDTAGVFLFAGEQYSLNDWYFRERLQDELWRLYDRRGWLYLQAQRLGRYRPMIEAELTAQGLPQDLLYLFIWESGLDPKAVSWAGAAGLAQFMPGTARQFKLAVASLYDERKNPVDAVRAACRYLKVLYGYFNDWQLAMASYNHGENAVRSKLSSQKVKQFTELYLPNETYRYVFQIMAVSYVFKNGLLGDITWLQPHQPYPAYKKTQTKITKAVSLYKLSEELGVDFNTFRLLNPHLPVYLSAGTYPINLPAS